MQKFVFILIVAAAAGTSNVHAEPAQRARAAKTATLAILVTDPAGAQIPNVSVTVAGAASRTVRTEGGRIAIESLPPGGYLLRFEREGFITLERELTARAGAPTEVKVTLQPAPSPEPPPAPVAPPKPPGDGKPAMVDVIAVAEKEFVGRAAGRTTSLACGDEGSATLIQLNDPVTDHTHADADEFIYVVAGEGAANVAGTPQRLRAGVLVFVPRGVVHRFSRSGRNPLIVVSTRAGEGCGPVH
ncbi:MAG TPA: carboxypeptidase regulatory-like domain-containing protein [Vicinamibacterales bacterium]|nr:carboxypeptidase regulatory-like domain-containing protein [Vicinamibacterales bacterium]